MQRKYMLICLVFALSNTGMAQEDHANIPANYRLAARFSPEKLKRLIFSTSVDPQWLKNSNRFWYTYETSEGKNWYLVDPDARRKDALFDNALLAAQLKRFVNDPFDSQHIASRTERKSVV